MEDYTNITDKLELISRDIKAFEATYQRFISTLLQHYRSGSIDTVRDFSFSVVEDEKIIKIQFLDFNFVVVYKFKREDGTSKGLLNIYQLTEDEERLLINSQEFKVDGIIKDTSLCLDDEMDCMTILLNLVERAI